MERPYFQESRVETWVLCCDYQTQQSKLLNVYEGDGEGARSIEAEFQIV